jgi:hypothetical protein
MSQDIVNKVFFDVNLWMRRSILEELNFTLKDIGKIVNLEMDKKTFFALPDREIFILLYENRADNEKIWLITRDKKIYQHIPSFINNEVLVIFGFDNVRKYFSQLDGCCLIVIILDLGGVKRKRLNKKVQITLRIYILHEHQPSDFY